MTPVAAEGNGHTDLGKPTTDDTSARTTRPDGDVDAPRTIDNSCKSMPTEADGVIGVTSVGPATRKAYYSDYGVEQADVAAPGGDTRDTPDGSRKIDNAILAAYPDGVGVADGDDRPATATSNDPVVSRSSRAGRTTSTSRAPRWPRRTRWASRR